MWTRNYWPTSYWNSSYWPPLTAIVLYERESRGGAGLGYDHEKNIAIRKEDEEIMIVIVAFLGLEG